MAIRVCKKILSKLSKDEMDKLLATVDRMGPARVLSLCSETCQDYAQAYVLMNVLGKECPASVAECEKVSCKRKFAQRSFMSCTKTQCAACSRTSSIFLDALASALCTMPCARFVMETELILPAWVHRAKTSPRQATEAIPMLFVREMALHPRLSVEP